MGVLGLVGKTSSIDTLQDVLTTVAEGGTSYHHLTDILHRFVKNIGPEAHQKLAPISAFSDQRRTKSTI